MKTYYCTLGKHTTTINAGNAQEARDIARRHFENESHVRNMTAWVEKGWTPTIKARRIKVRTHEQLTVEERERMSIAQRMFSDSTHHTLDAKYAS
jgi:hypothetical protein